MPDPSPTATGLAFALSLDGRGGRVDPPAPDQVAWQHFRLENDGAPALVERSGIPAWIATELLRENARPRASHLEGGLLVVLRGVNLNPGADPEDMVSVRTWIARDEIVSVSPRRVMAIEDLAALLREGEGPATPAEFLVVLAERLVERMRPILDDLEARTEALEDRLIDDSTAGLDTDLAELQRVVIQLRRHLAPQRDALSKLHREPVDWLDAESVSSLREVADRTSRFVEHLDSLRDQGKVLHDQLDARTNAKLNRNLYLMTVVASVFLPLSFVTGLLGINVAGMPGVDWPTAFWVVVGLLVALTVVEIVILRRYRIIGSAAR